jgi:hypothetical protein
MKIKILQDTVALKRLVKEGEVLDVEPNEASLLIGLGKAEMVEDPAPVDPPAPPVEPPKEEEKPEAAASAKKGKK